MSISPRWSFLSVSATRACSSSTTGRSPARHVRPSDTAEKHCRTRPTNIEAILFYLLRYCVFCTSHVRNVGIPPKFYLPGICLGGSQSAVAARFLVVVPYGVGLSLQIEVRKLALNPGYRPKCVSVLACVPLWQWAFLLFELYGRGTRGRPECVSGMAGQALRHNG